MKFSEMKSKGLGLCYLWKAHMHEQMARMNDQELSAAKIKRAERLAIFYYNKSKSVPEQ